MKTDCGRLSALLGAYADGELDAALTEQVKAHVATCAECRRELEALNQLHQLVRRAGPPEPRDEYWDWHRTRVWRRLNQDTREHQRFYRPSFVWPKLATLAGALVVLVVAIVGWQTLGPGLGKHREHAPVDKLLVSTAPPAPAGRAESERPAPVIDEVSSGGSGRQARGVQTGQAEAVKGVGALETEGRKAESRTGAATVQQPAAVATIAEKKDAPRDRDRASSAGRKSRVSRSETSVREMTDDELRKTPVESLAGILKGGTVLQVVGAESKVADVKPVQLAMPSVPATDDTGTTIVGLTTDTLGAVVAVRVMRSSGKPKLDSIALVLARKSRFSPGKRAGKPARFDFELPYRFNKLAQKKTTK